MYLNRMMLVIGLAVFLAPPMIVQLSQRSIYGWLVPAVVWALVTLVVFLIMRTKNQLDV
ncbi:MAG: hypothetical protein RLY58_360 [Pseudomonadota bacterium]